MNIKERYKLAIGSNKHYTSYVGPPWQYDLKGAMQFRLLCSYGLRETHSLLDFGCGSLRAGRLFIPYLSPGNYFGIEPNKWLIEEAIKNEIGDDIVRIKKPNFFYNNDFSCSHLGKKFDFILAQSICSHTGEDLIEKILSEFSNAIEDNGTIFMTFILSNQKCTQKGWIYPGCVMHKEETLVSYFKKNNFYFKKLKWWHDGQTWFILSKNAKNIPTDQENLKMSGNSLFRKT